MPFHGSTKLSYPPEKISDFRFQISDFRWQISDLIKFAICHLKSAIIYWCSRAGFEPASRRIKGGIVKSDNPRFIRPFQAKKLRFTI
ncbi:MAG TPA: hypothetical protein DCY88_30905 [Cyanobacteria bacterium UBA11372]|nr:hypothetical protein [Cyanobacteria bacterium UBA11372]